MTLPNDELTNAEAMEVARQMDAQLDLYIPADEKDESAIEMYDRLFIFLRKLYFLYGSVTKEEVKQYFVNFYNSDYIARAEILNQLETKTNVIVDRILKEFDEYPELVKEQSIELFLKAESRIKKALILYYMQNGVLPDETTIIEPYLTQVDAIESDVSNQLKEQEDVEIIDPAITSVPGVEVEPVELDQSPEAVVSRYLKGSGVYDPALRNSGFRVDTDVEK